MFTILRAHHIKRILIALAIIIIPAFVLWGAIAYFKTKDSGALGEIDKQKISPYEFLPFYRMAEMQYAMQKKDAFTAQLIKKTAWDTLLLNRQANKEKIKVSDEEVTKKIVQLFSFVGGFKKEAYFRYLKTLRMQPRAFEEQMRTTLKIEKLYKKHAEVKIDENEIRKLYDKDTREAKISYLFVPFDNFSSGIKVSEKEIEEFYNKNKESFKEEAKVKIKYLLVAKDDPRKDEILKAADAIDDLDIFAAQFGRETKESGYFQMHDRVLGIGYEPEVNDFAFMLKKGEIGEAIEIQKGYCIMENTGHQDAHIPALADIKNEAGKRAEQEVKKQSADKYCRVLTGKISKEKIDDLKILENDKNVKFGETSRFKYNDFLPIAGGDTKIKDIIFNLKKNEIYGEPISAKDGFYIIQVKELSEFDPADFAAKKQGYIDYMKLTRAPEERAKYLADLKEKTGFKLYQR